MGTYPWAGEIAFSFDGAAKAKRLSWRDRDGRDLEAQRFELRTEELRIPSGDAKLAATLYLPPGAGPYPAVVAVHGSGRETRDGSWNQAMTRIFLGEGVAVLLYDKRGVGQSGGDYVPGPYVHDNTSPENIERLASDARAAAAMLAARPDIDRKRVGLFGISQAGWIMPLAAAKSQNIHFIIDVSGPAVPTSLEAIHSDLLNDGERPSEHSLEEVDAIVQRAPRVGFDSAPSIASLDISVLFLYGMLDTSIPVPECLRVLDALQKQRKHDFQIATFPNAGHSLLEVPRDLETENELSPGMAPGFVSTVRAWVRAHVRAH
jgi:dienelactone hydrolase